MQTVTTLRRGRTTRKTPTWRLTSGAAVLLTCAFTIQAWGQSKGDPPAKTQPDDAIIQGPHHASFIPQRQLTSPRGELRTDLLPSRAVSRLQTIIRSGEAVGAGPCLETPRLYGDSFEGARRYGEREKRLQERDPEAPPWAIRMAMTALTLRVHVVSLTPGLLVDTLSPGTLVRVVVDKVIRNTSGREILPNHRFTYLQHVGQITVGDATLCGVADGERLPSLGDSLILTGFLEETEGAPLALDPTTDVISLTSDGTASLRGTRGKETKVSLTEVERILRSLGNQK